MTSAKTPLTIFDKLYKAYGGSMGKMLIHTGVIGWALSSAAQIFAIAINDKIHKKQKPRNVLGYAVVHGCNKRGLGAVITILVTIR